MSYHNIILQVKASLYLLFFLRQGWLVHILCDSTWLYWAIHSSNPGVLLPTVPPPRERRLSLKDAILKFYLYLIFEQHYLKLAISFPFTIKKLKIN